MALKKMKFSKLSKLKSGFFLYKKQVYYVKPQGSWILYFPVIDGKIVDKYDHTNIAPWEKIEAIPSEEFEKYGIPADIKLK